MAGEVENVIRFYRDGEYAENFVGDTNRYWYVIFDLMELEGCE